MPAKASYLRRSSTGRYSYRRKVPKELAPYFPRTSNGRVMREWKQSFRTKDASVAQRRWVEENRKFDQAERVALALRSGQPQNTSDYEALQIAKQIAIEAGFHPDQAPKLPVDANDDDWAKYKEDRRLWLEWLEEQRNLIAETDAENRTDYQKLERDYKSGRWAEPDYETPIKKANPKSVLSLAARILEGDLKPPVVSTWADATETYISVSKQNKSRDVVIQHKWEVKTRGLLNRFALFLGGRDTALAELDRSKIRTWLQSTYENQSTRNRYINTLRAVINNWNRENVSTQIPNPFSGLANKQREQEQAKKRQSFKPEQLKKYIEAILSHSDEEVRLIGLLMAWTGCRTSEASGLETRDVKLALLR